MFGIYMHLLGLEIGLLVVLAALGSLPAALLGTRVPGVRAALAPAFGLAVAGCACLTASAVMPGRIAAWLVLGPLTLASLALALRRARRRRGTPLLRADRRLIAEMLAIVLVVTAAFNLPLAKRHSLGPVIYNVADAAFYVPTASALRDHRLGDSDWGPAWSLVVDANRRGISTGVQVAFPALEADAGEFFDSAPTDSNAPFLIAVLVVAALGIFAAVRFFAARATLAALVAGLLVAGPLFYSLFLESSDAAIAAIPSVVPALICTTLYLRHRRLSDLVLLGISLAAIPTFHPGLAPPLVFLVVVVVAVLWVRAARAGRATRGMVGDAAAALLALLVVVLVTSPLALPRTVEFVQLVKNVLTNFGGPLDAQLTLATTAPFLTQTRELYALRGLGPGPSSLITAAGAVGVLALVAIGLRRFRAAWLGLVVIVAMVVLAAGFISVGDCKYCGQRSLLLAAPVIDVLIGLGLVALASLSRRGALVAAGCALATLALVGHMTTVAARRLVDGAHMVPAAYERLAALARRQAGPLYLEGNDALWLAIREAPLLYTAAADKSLRHLMVDRTQPEFFAYPGAVVTPSARANGYTEILTRFGSIQTRRTVIARAGPFALERPARPFDVAVDAGAELDFLPLDPAQRAWVYGPITLTVTAASHEPAWLRATLSGPSADATTVSTPASAEVIGRGPGTLTVCAAVPGNGRVRTLTLGLSFPPIPAGPRGPFIIDQPVSQSLALTAMAADPQDCHH
ncbi:MAG: hypothetical protein ACJ76X_09220 [Solirubrobacteraceae bacterium]